MVETASTLAVHRCRFVDFTPSAVTALCFPPLPLPSVKGKKAANNRTFPGFGPLVIGRANGNIELCEWTGSSPRSQAPQAWVVRKTLVGPYPSKVESLALTFRSPRRAAQEEIPSWSNLRLFSAGGGSELVEWDIEQGCIKRTISSQGGPIWSIAPNPASTILALGCEDGSVRLVSLLYDELTHLRRLDRMKSRILSIAWGPPAPKQKKTQSSNAQSDSDDDDDDEWTDSWLVAGLSDSSLRKLDFATGRSLDRMGTDKIRGERTLVWAVGVLGDGTIVSGDSMGNVKFWDSKTCTQLQSFQGHAADVLCLTISPDGTAVYTSGVDQKVTQFSYVKTSRSDHNPSPLVSRSSGRWVQTSSRRLHSHDVRALAIWPPHTPLPPSHQRQFPVDVAPVLASGGLDMSVVLTPAALPTATLAGKVMNPLATSTTATFEDAYHRRLAYTSGPASSSALHLARKARLLMCTREAGLTVWRIARRQQKGEEDGEMEVLGAQDGGWERVLDMDLNVQTNIVSGAISDDGKWLAVADWYETKLFRLREESNGDLKPRRIRNFASLIQSQVSGSSSGASSLIFTPDSSKLVLATSTSSTILIIDLGSADRPPRVLRKFEQHRLREGFVNNRVIKGRKGPSASPAADGDVEMATEDQDASPEAEDKDRASNHGSNAESDSDDDVEDAKLVRTTITRMAVSPDGQWLATADDRRRTHVFNLDSVQHHCALPTFPHPIHALAFDASAPNTLVLGFADNALEVYDVEARHFPRWARALVNALPQRFTHLHDPVLGVTFDPGHGEEAAAGGASPLPPKTALFWGATWICKVNLTERIGYGGFEKRRRGKRKAAETNANDRVEVQTEEGQQEHQRNFKLVTHYRPLLFVDFVAPGELVVVERPLVDVLAKLPPAYFKPKYGAS
ncbi:WD40 repeat-like protein [Trametes coccinea BRFM310]|uniref:WD40 repeat-like protein n=1 Tax=Trametes coccinea (strain BRFM310) TaxID=1353009 RepID=A0A1Y2IZI1_TRAC3|nr:WD40 repeat-like protein [Trametes coccinea BRFM310]